MIEKDSIMPLVKYWWLIVVSIVLALVFVWFAQGIQEKNYEGALTITARQMVVADKSGENYKFDGYYAVAGNQMIADTFEAWLNSPDVVKEIGQKAGIQMPTSLTSLRSFIEVEKVVSQSVCYKVKMKTEREVNDLLIAARDVVKEKTEKLLVTEDGKPVFTIEYGNPVVEQYTVDSKITYGVGILAGLCIGVFGSYVLYSIKEAMKENS